MDLSALNDHDLLRRYAHHADEPAFAELVRRHLNLVYSAARRQTRSPELAQDVAQLVFIDLARAARTFDSRTPPVAWLHLVTRRTAIDVIRRESRRQQRDHIAATDPSAMNPPPPPSPWSQLEPQLDEALTELSEPERTAVLLRFFENKSLREVGCALGTSEEAARKRVSRALEQLRTVFLRRGLTLTSATLAAHLSAHVIQIAPVALGPSISSVAIAAAGTSIAVLKTTPVILMTSFQKTALIAVLTFAAGAGLFEANSLHRENSRLEALRARAEQLSTELARARAESATANRELAAVDAKIDERVASTLEPLSGADLAAAEQMKTWLANIDRLKKILQQQPALNIPELSLVDEQTWLSVAAQMPLETDENVRRALSQLRQRGENLLGIKIMAALGRYMKSGATVLPLSPAELLPFFDPPISPEMLERYQMLQSGLISALPENVAGMKLIGAISPADPVYDSLLSTGTKGFAFAGAMDENVDAAQRRFAQANGGEKATTGAQLQPFLKWPVDAAAVDQHLVSRAQRTKK